MRILVTGSRLWADCEAVWAAISQQVVSQTYGTPIIIVHGDAAGADYHARRLAENVRPNHPLARITHEPHPANWAKLGKAAGAIRNQEMVDLGADVCLAFPLGESRGTRDCMRRAEAAGIPVLNYGDA